MIKGTQAENIIEKLRLIPRHLRSKVEEVTLDMVANMNLAVKRCFPSADRIIDRFHVQRLAYDAVQELRIKYRWQVLDEENEQIKKARAAKARIKRKVRGIFIKFIKDIKHRY